MGLGSRGVHFQPRVSKYTYVLGVDFNRCMG